MGGATVGTDSEELRPVFSVRTETPKCEVVVEFAPLELDACSELDVAGPEAQGRLGSPGERFQSFSLSARLW